MERDPRDRFEEFEELRFGDEPADEPQPAPDEHTTFDRARFDVFDSDFEAEPDLVFTPEPLPAPDADHSPNFEADTSEALTPDEIDQPAPDWWTSTPDPEPLEDIPFELLAFDVFDVFEDDLE